MAAGRPDHALDGRRSRAATESRPVSDYQGSTATGAVGNIPSEGSANNPADLLR